VLFGRFIVILRTYAAFLAGASRMRWLRFLPANAAGGVLWAGTYTLAAYLAGDSLRRLSGTIDLILGGAGVLIIVVVGMAIRRGTERLSARAEAAYPGPID
jgi:membrane protein DedA with SNARE-associated domain